MKVLARARLLGRLSPLVWASASLACAEGEVRPRKRAPTEAAGPTLDPAVSRAIAAGEKLFFDRAACSACHRVGKRGGMIVGPNLGVGDGMDEVFSARAAKRRPELMPIEYAVESIVDPDAFVVASYAPGVMKAIDDLPAKLDDQEIVSVAAYVAAHGQSEGLTPADLERAAAQVPVARAARSARRSGGAAAPPPPPTAAAPPSPPTTASGAASTTSAASTSAATDA